MTMSSLKSLISKRFGPFKRRGKAPMETKKSSQKKIPDREKPKAITVVGKDEMNLAEFPFASLSRRESRKSIELETWITDKKGNREKQRWVVSGSSTAGLPTEVDERTYVALMVIAKQQGFRDRKTPFSIYQVLKTIGLPTTSKREYRKIEKSLKRLIGATIYAEGAFWDNEKKELRKRVTGFHIIDKYWLAYKEKDEWIIEEEGVPAYIVWGEDIWNSVQKGYIKSLDVGFFFGLKSAVSRRLYRLLDKKFYRRDNWEIDIFTLSQKLGMARYRYPSKVWEKLKPGIDELKEKRFLKDAYLDRVHSNGKVYTRVVFVKTAKRFPQSEENPPHQGKPKPDPPDEKARFWKEVLGELKLKVTKATFETWLRDTRLLSLDEKKAVIGVKNGFVKDWLENRLRKVVKRTLEDFGHNVELEFKDTQEKG